MEKKVGDLFIIIRPVIGCPMSPGDIVEYTSAGEFGLEYFESIPRGKLWAFEEHEIKPVSMGKIGKRYKNN